MNWYDRLLRKRKPKDVIPNPREKKLRLDAIDAMGRQILHVAQFLCFALALLILAAVSQ